MKRVETIRHSWSTYSHMYSFIVPSYSKLLDVNIINHQLEIIYEYDDINTGTKTFSFYIGSGSSELYPPYLHEYLKSITTQEDQRIETISTGMGVNFNLSPAIERLNYVFFQDQKSLDEDRDEKLNEILDETIN